MVSEELMGGLISALSRGEPLQKAMMTFYNAGYGKEEIEEAAKIVYSQVGAETAKTGYIKEAVKTIASKVGLVKKPAKVNTIPQKNSSPANPAKSVIQTSAQTLIPPKNPNPPEEEVQDTDEGTNQNSVQPSVQNKVNEEKKPQEKEQVDKTKNNLPKKIGDYERDNYNATYQNAEQITSKIEKAIKELKNINLPSKIEVINKNVDSKYQPTVVQRVSHYGDEPPKQVSKVVTYILVFILILLLGVLAAIFFFKDDLIKIFNNLGLS